jgi:N,N'-diacetyllegionaminate synthase
MTEITIAGNSIGAARPPFLIAEVGINHNGELDRALEMIAIAKAAKADAVKFQTFKAAEFVGDPQQMFTYQSQGRPVTESMLSMFRRYELPDSAWLQIKRECDRLGIVFLSTPQNRGDLELLLRVGVPAIKIGSDDFTNLPLIKDYAAAGLPLILSCGMSDLAEVHQALEAAGAFGGHPVALLLCTSQYPTPPQDVNLRKLGTLRGAFPELVLGFSDHTQGSLAASLAVALGARIFEKHFTLAHDLPGPDHWFSEDPQGLSQWTADIRRAYLMLGDALVRPTAAELQMRTLARRSVVILEPVAAGATLTQANVGLRRPGTGLAPGLLHLVIGRRAARDLPAGTVLTLEDTSC